MYLSVTLLIPGASSSPGSSKLKPSGRVISARVCPQCIVWFSGTSYSGISFSAFTSSREISSMHTTCWSVISLSTLPKQILKNAEGSVSSFIVNTSSISVYSLVSDITLSFEYTGHPSFSPPCITTRISRSTDDLAFNLSLYVLPASSLTSSCLT